MSRIVWCTGASKGIGRALALRLARNGDTVAASARSAEELQAVADEAERLTGAIVPFPLDVTDETAVTEVVAAIEEKLGPIDVAVLNAGTHQPINAEDFASDPFRKLMDVNVMGTVHALAALLPRFMARRAGRIAVVASVAGYRGLPTASAYGATKAALINMLEALKPELDSVGVRLTLINPGFVKTPLTDKNEFKMPFLMEVDEAADRIAKGLERDRFEVTFPRRFTWMLKLGRILPYSLYFPMIKRLILSGK